MNPFFSIVIANFNQGSFIEQAIQSVIKQDLNNYELIIIDGNSVDNSVDIIKKYDNYISWWVSEKDSGQSNAFNKGFSHARGLFYLWLNADDLLLPDTLNNAYRYITKHPSCKWLAGDTIFFDQDQNILRCSRSLPYNRFLCKYGSLSIGGPTSFFHRDLFNEAGGFEESYHYAMDTDLWLTFIKNGHTYKRLNHHCWGFRIHENSKTSHKFSAKERPKDEIIEGIHIRKKHNRELYQWVDRLQRLFKLFGGYYFRSYIKTEKWKGKSIVNYK